MKKGKIKRAVEKALKEYYKKGLTATADKFRTVFSKELDKLYDTHHKRKKTKKKSYEH